MGGFGRLICLCDIRLLQKSGPCCISGGMSRLDWMRHGDGWRAGRYEIELAAPGLWVCSRRHRSRPERTTIEMTSGSLSALKARVEKMDSRRRGTRRSLTYFFAAMVAMLIVGLLAESSHGAAPIGVFVMSCLGIVFLIRAVDAVVQRSWEALNLHYQ